MADAATPISSACIRPLFPDLDLHSPSSTPVSDPDHHHLTVPRLRRGPMYSAYSELRESKLRKKREGSVTLCSMSGDTFTTPEKKVATAAAPSIVRSVPDFSAVLRKENRRPAAWASPAPPRASKLGGTPPKPPPATVAASCKRGVVGVPRRAEGGASAGGRDEKGGAVRKSYSCLRELKGLSGGVVSSAIEEEGREPRGTLAANSLARRYY